MKKGNGIKNLEIKIPLSWKARSSFLESKIPLSLGRQYTSLLESKIIFFGKQNHLSWKAISSFLESNMPLSRKARYRFLKRQINRSWGCITEMLPYYALNMTFFCEIQFSQLSLMKFICQVDIDLPRDRVVQLFDNAETLKEWQDGFVSREHVSGVPGATGSKTRCRYQSGKREIVLIETIITRDFPDEFTALYEAKEMTNTMSNKFSALSENSTRYVAEINYIKLNGFRVRIMATLFPGMFRRQTQKWLDQFKSFCERSGFEG